MLSVLVTLVIVIVVGAFLYATAEKHGFSLSNPQSIYNYSKEKGDALNECYGGNTPENIRLWCEEQTKKQGNNNNADSKPAGVAADYKARLNTIPIGDKQDVNYRRADWRHWVNQGECDTRVTVLKNQGQNIAANGCKITGGTWVSLYDNKTVTSSSLIDIDHVIPLKYAATHGGDSWDAATKERFANDTTQLLAVSRESNRSKSDKGPGEYMPDDSYKCEYSKKWVDTVQKYPGLRISTADKQALEAGLNTCH